MSIAADSSVQMSDSVKLRHLANLHVQKMRRVFPKCAPLLANCCRKCEPHVAERVVDGRSFAIVPQVKRSEMAAICRSAGQRSDDGSHQDHEAMVEDQWQIFFEDSSMWWGGNGRNKIPRRPAFRYATTGVVLWLDSEPD